MSYRKTIYELVDTNLIRDCVGKALYNIACRIKPEAVPEETIYKSTNGGGLQSGAAGEFECDAAT